MKPEIKPNEVTNLAPMPASVVRLAGIVCDPQASAQDIADVIQYDQALAASALRLANSAWAGVRTPADTVKDAVLRIGVGRVLEMAVGGRISGQMDKAIEGYELAEHELWRHSVAAALAAEKMTGFTKGTIPGASFTASLLHDIGKLLVGRHLGPQVVHAIKETARAKQITYIEAEREILGTDHAEVGAAIARNWGFPELLVVAIEKHHDPDSEPQPILDVVHVANAVAKLAGVGLGSEALNMKASGNASRRLGISPTGLEALCAAVAAGLKEAEELWRVSDDGSERISRG